MRSQRSQIGVNAREKMEKEASAKSQVHHWRTVCDSCGNTITGVRYKCGYELRIGGNYCILSHTCYVMPFVYCLGTALIMTCVPVVSHNPIISTIKTMCLSR